jgi:hypothetical protein
MRPSTSISCGRELPTAAAAERLDAGQEFPKAIWGGSRPRRDRLTVVHAIEGGEEEDGRYALAEAADVEAVHLGSMMSSTRTSGTRTYVFSAVVGDVDRMSFLFKDATNQLGEPARLRPEVRTLSALN